MNLLLKGQLRITKKLNILILSILPITLIFIGFLLKNEIGSYYLLSVDPEYCYLFNGLNIAHLSFPWHVDHPGTPLQVLIAIVIRIVHLFHNNNIHLDKDLFNNPELYLSAIINTILMLQGIVLFTTGHIIYKRSNNLLTAIFFQYTPFVSFSILYLLGAILVEQLLIIIVICLILIVFLYLKNENFKQKLIDKYLILFSIIIGLGMATKIIFFPLLFIPLMLLPGIKKKVLYLILTIISFVLFAFPILNRLGYFRDWIVNLFMHSGFYGNGPKTVIETGTFISNLKIIFTTDIFFTIVFFAIILGCVLYLLPFLKVKKKNDRQLKCLVGVAIAMILIILLVAKHYNYRYLMSALLLMTLGIYLLISIYTRQIYFLKKKYIVLPLIIVLLGYVFHFEVKKIFSAYLYQKRINESYYNTINIIEKNYKNSPTLILANYMGTPYKEYGLFFGTAWCGEKMRNYYSSTLIDLYPYTYIYHGWNNLFNYWNNSYSYIDLLKKYRNIILFSGNPEFEKSLNSKFFGINRQKDTKINKVFFNDKTNESIYTIKYDTLYNREKIVYSCDAEKTDSSKNKFIGGDSLIFENGYTQSSEKHRSGNYSVKLTKDNPYAMTSYISEIKNGEHYKISVWIYNNGNSNAGIIITSKDSVSYYQFQTESTVTIGDWKKIEFDFTATQLLNNQDIKLGCLNNNKDLPAYFDDLLIQKY
jgi:hypothetical protein